MYELGYIYNVKRRSLVDRYIDAEIKAYKIIYIDKKDRVVYN